MVQSYVRLHSSSYTRPELQMHLNAVSLCCRFIAWFGWLSLPVCAVRFHSVGSVG
jgi:hypothetical protein